MAGTPSTPVPGIPALRLAVVEDDDELRERILLPALRTAGFEALGFSSALDLYREWMRAPFALVLLDVGLPDEDGVEIARHLRTLTDSVGIVMCSAHGRGADRMRGLRAGADAYLVKPLDVDEIVETLRNLARRLSGADTPAAPASGWSLGQRGWALVTPAGTSIALSRNEREVMTVLAQSTGETVPREALVMRLGCDTADFDPHRLEMLVYRLRRKCEAAGHPLALATVRGVGYRLDW
mgnify:FL=1